MISFSVRKNIEQINVLYIADSVENLMADTHDLGGSTVVVDRATPKASYSIANL